MTPTALLREAARHLRAGNLAAARDTLGVIEGWPWDSYAREVARLAEEWPPLAARLAEQRAGQVEPETRRETL